MQIKTDIRVITGDHNGIPFALEGGLLTIGGQKYSKSEIKALVQIANLLEVEGHKLKDTLPHAQLPRRAYDPFGNWIGYYMDPSAPEEEQS